VAVKTAAKYKVRKLQSQERLAAIEKGLPLPPDDPRAVEALRPPNPARRIGYLRTSGIICLAVGIGVMLFFMAVTHITQNRMVLCGAATGLIPLAIGAGLLLDARMQAKALKETQAASAPEPPVYPQE